MINLLCNEACKAIAAEDQFLKNHSAGLYRYHHGITFLDERLLVYFIFRGLISQAKISGRYEVRIEEPYPRPNNRNKADLVIIDHQEKNSFWIEAKWINDTNSIQKIFNDADKLKQYLGTDVEKLILVFWVKELTHGFNVGEAIEKIKNYQKIRKLVSQCTFKTSILIGQVYKDVEAGVTLVSVD